MIKVVPFEPEHAEKIRLREKDLEGIRPLDPVKMIQGIAQTGPFCSIMVDREVMAVGGVMMFWPGCGEAWLGTSGLAEKYPLSFTKLVKGFIDYQIKENHLHRIQLNVVESNHKSLSWVRLLGFVLESKMERYGPNKETYFRFVRLS